MLYVYLSDIALAVVILATGVISSPLTIVLCYVMEIKNFVEKGGEHLEQLQLRFMYAHIS